MTTYKLFRIKNRRLYPLFVETDREMKIGEWLEAGIGEKADDTHVKSKLGPLSLRPGFHSTQVPFTDWIGKRDGDRLIQRKDTVWCECDVDGEQVEVKNRYGMRTVPKGWYFFKTRPRQLFPWIISQRIFIRRVLDPEEVAEICRAHGVEPQPVE
ncbi:MAG: hypothetical protein K6C08_05805 [Oscillospiraceae bacterium]|nr:hypothetical protein [Oscillospiraceae bacterium]